MFMRLSQAAALALACGTTTCTFAQSAPQQPAAQPSKQQLPDVATTPSLFVIAYAHLDTQWRWCYPQVIREYLANTLNDNFKLIDKYPHYTFNFSGSRRYQMMAEYYPEQYERLKKEIAAGRWFPCGSSVDENDANVPSGESYIRHVLYGNNYFRKEFGIASDEYMLPDCFGFPAAVPSLLAHCGVQQFSTQKLTWNAVVPIPFKVGVWNGPDGKGVIAGLDPGAYVGEVMENLANSDGWRNRINTNGKASGVYADLHYYGTGDQGGAPTERSVAMMEESVNTKGPLTILAGRADQLAHAITPELRAKLPTYAGELQLTEHSAGSITSQAYMKRWNRKNELLADNAERASVAATWLGARAYPAAKIENAWTLILGSQMHDILPGTSHPWAYHYSWNDEILAANQLSSVLEDAMGVLASQLDTTGKGQPLVLYNPLSTDRTDVVEATIPGNIKSARSVT
ncbi:MAG: alpha-mannosidase, partial [Phycisphaerae bacterium]